MGELFRIPFFDGFLAFFGPNSSGNFRNFPGSFLSVRARIPAHFGGIRFSVNNGRTTVNWVFGVYSTFLDHNSRGTPRNDPGPIPLGRATIPAHFGGM